MLNKDQLAAASKSCTIIGAPGPNSQASMPRARRSPELRWRGSPMNYAGLGVTLGAGEVVTTGTCHAPLPIQSGDFLKAGFPSLGKVSVRFE
jgi:hypothetical protein